MLSHITFTGWDGHTDLEALKDFLRAYPPRSIEVAVLISEGRMGNDRYPEVAHAHRLLETAQEARQRTALHVCGPQARAMISLGGRTTLVAGLVTSADRVQINVATMEWLTPAHTIARTIDRTVIVQHRNPLGWPEAQPGVEYLFDRSGGRGESLLTTRSGEPCGYPTPAPDRTVGYAGGLGPDNVAEFMGRIYARNGRNERYWIDMETGIRERLDSYPGGPKVAADVPPPTQVSIAKCRAVMSACQRWFRP